MEKFMKKFVFFVLALFMGIFCMISSQNVWALETVVIKEVYGNLVSPNSCEKVVLKGQKDKDSFYFSNVWIEIYDKNDKQLGVIAPKEKGGYEPDVIVENFTDNGTSQIFYAASSGGSGGFGYYYVYDFSACVQTTLFDFAEFSKNNRLEGKYLDCFRAQVSNSDGGRYLIDLSDREKQYKNSIWQENGKLIKPIDVNVSGVNAVFPYYSHYGEICKLKVYRRVTGLYNADLLGYVLTDISLLGGKSEITSEGLLI